MKIHEMKIHEVLRISVKSLKGKLHLIYYVVRVPGGWIYRDINDNAVFVPFNMEGKAPH